MHLSFHGVVNDINNWQLRTFPTGSVEGKLRHLNSEIQEVFEAIHNKESQEAIDMEFADCFILLIGAAAKYGLEASEILEVIDKKMKINKTRTWEKREDGLTHHIK